MVLPDPTTMMLGSKGLPPHEQAHGGDLLPLAFYNAVFTKIS